MRELSKLLSALLWSLLLWSLVGLVSGMLFGVPVAGMLVAVIAWQLWTLLQLLRFMYWLQRGAPFPPPDGCGFWRGVYSGLEHRLRSPKSAPVSVAEHWWHSFKDFRSGVIALDMAGAVLWCNQLAATLLGLRLPSDQGRRLDSLLRTPELSNFLRELPSDREIECASPEDSERRLRFRCVNLQTRGSLVFVDDISASRHLEKMRQDFIANLSHELRTPLTVIVGDLELLEQGMSAEQMQTLLTDMRLQSRRMSDLVQSLLELAHLESLNAPAVYEPVALYPLLKEICDSLCLRDTENLRPELHCAANLQILGERRELHSIFHNLLENALRFSTREEGAWVRIFAERDAQGGLKIGICDNGEGIERHHLRRLTERFYRADAGRITADGGAGLGLAIVKHALERHQGSLKINSHPGQGSEFYCHFPPQRCGISG